MARPKPREPASQPPGAAQTLSVLNPAAPGPVPLGQAAMCSLPVPAQDRTRAHECFRWLELVTGCLTGLAWACRGYASVDLGCPGRGPGPCVCILEVDLGRAVTDVIGRW